MKELRWLFCVLLFMILRPAAAQRPDAPEYAQRGSYSVGTRDYVIEDGERLLNATIWYPAINPDNRDEVVTYTSGVFVSQGTALRDAEPNLNDAPFPLVLFSHGNAGFRFQSIFLMEHLASHGFVIIAIDHPGNTVFDAMNDAQFNQDFPTTFALRPDDMLRTITHAENVLSSGDFVGVIDFERIAITGHSLGGYTALSLSGLSINFRQLATACETGIIPFVTDLCFLLEEEPEIALARGLGTAPNGAWPAITDERIDAVIAFAPWNGPIFDSENARLNDTPIMILAGSADDITPPSRDSQPLYNSLFMANPKAFIQFENAGHYIFVDECTELVITFGLFDRCSDPIWDMQRVHDLTNHFTTAFLLANLFDDAEALEVIGSQPGNFPGVTAQVSTEQVELLVPDVLSERPHDSNAYTQGLLLYEGALYESTGQYGESSLRAVNPETGEVIRQINLNEQFFGEGLARVDDRLIQITWREGAAIVFDLATFEFIEAFSYTTEGWGLCYDGEFLFMSDGSDRLFKRDAQTFEVVTIIPVRMRGEIVSRINELECVDTDIYANIYTTNTIVRIDKETGQVNAHIDAAGLLTQEEQANLSSGEVLNGIAYDEVNDVFLITGKNWPKLFEVRFVPVAD